MIKKFVKRWGKRGRREGPQESHVYNHTKKTGCKETPMQVREGSKNKSDLLDVVR